MWSLNNWKIVFLAVGLIGVLIFSSPTIVMFVRAPSGEPFSELYVLGPTHLAEGYPFNVSAGKDYLVYLGIIDHLGRSAYYKVEMKLRNSTDALPNSTAGVASPLPALYSYRVFLGDGQTWEGSLKFSFSNVSFVNDLSTVGGISINDAAVVVDKSASHDSVDNGYFYELFMELWLFNTTSNAFNFDSRYVGFWLNMTATS
jgi:hypothetical protein